MGRKLSLVLVGLLLLGVISACGQSEESQPTATPIPGWERFEGRGVELWLPESFEGGDLGKDVDVIAQNLRRFAPDSEQIAQMIEQNPEMYALWAFDTEVGDQGFLTNAAVTTEKVMSSITLDVYLDAALKQFPAWLRMMERDIVDIGDYQAGRLLIEFDMVGIEGQEVMYAIKDGNTMWVITYATGADEWEERFRDFEQSASTFKVLP